MKNFAAALLITTTVSLAPQLASADTAILAGGCFWCVESDMMKLKGVTDAVSGYAGGSTQSPTYKNYSSNGHIEVVKVTYNADELSYRELLNFHLRHIDPTDGDGQFCDRGASYRPAIFIEGDEQSDVAKDELAKAAKQLDQAINVDILPSAQFWPAEDYHQNYAETNSTKYKFYRWKCDRDSRVKELWRN